VSSDGISSGVKRLVTSSYKISHLEFSIDPTLGNVLARSECTNSLIYVPAEARI